MPLRDLPLESLTVRETEVLSAYAEAGTYEATANRLFLSRETVKSHLANARLKLGALNTTNAVAIGIRRGLI